MKKKMSKTERRVALKSQIRDLAYRADHGDASALHELEGKIHDRSTRNILKRYFKDKGKGFRGNSNQTIYHLHGNPFQGGAPGLGKRK